MMMKMILSYTVLSLSILLLSCTNQEKKTTTQSNQIKSDHATKRVSVLEIKSPKAGEMFTIGDKIDLDIRLKKSDVIIDSLIIESGADKTLIDPNNIHFKWETINLNVGVNQIKVFAYSGGQKVDTYSLKLKFKSDIKPDLYRCKIIKTYPHDKKAYTQGLIFENGIMYEGTGQRGESVLKKIDFNSGKVISELSLPAEYFGEGITLFGDKIIQLTWTSKVGFVYDKNSFKLITKLEYSTQGWGLTADGEKLIMSDGTETIHFLDPEYFNEIGKIDVYDDSGPIENINELEYINGLVYANIYQTEQIIAFDLKTGKVIKRIDCSMIIPKGFKGEHDNVLNGIAYDHKNNRIFITGKRWPVLFEVRFLK